MATLEITCIGPNPIYANVRMYRIAAFFRSIRATANAHVTNKSVIPPKNRV